MGTPRRGTSSRRPWAAGAASTGSAPNRANRSRCSTTIVVTDGSRSRARNLRRGPQEAGLVGTPPTPPLRRRADLGHHPSDRKPVLSRPRGRPRHLPIQVGRGRAGVHGGPAASIATVGLSLDPDQGVPHGTGPVGAPRSADPPRRYRQPTVWNRPRAVGDDTPGCSAHRFRFVGCRGKSPDLAHDRLMASSCQPSPWPSR